jgi:hypothetical protein
MNDAYVTKPQNLIRTIPTWFGQPEQFFDIGPLTFDQQKAFISELKEQGCWVQNVSLGDHMPILVAVSIREQQKAEEPK